MFKLVDQPRLMPARSLTGSTVGPMVDTEVVLQTGGRPYLTEIEVAECAKFFPQVGLRLAADLGWASPDELADLQMQIVRLEEQLDEAVAAQPKVVPLEDVEKLLASGVAA